MPVPAEIRCTACGRAATTADRFCGFCGTRLDVEHPTPTSEMTGPNRPHADRILASLRAATIGEYDIAGELGRGGMAVVFLAHDLSLNRKVAIKALLPELLYTDGMDRRFKHEARIAAKLDHPNILVIHGVREATNLLYIVMKLVEGLPLSAIVKVVGPLPIPVVRLVIRSVADALAYAHGEGVVHRDVKPANIMVDRRGNVVVMDFGIAKAADDAHLTRTGLVIGTPAYMSPEQCLAHAVGSASDQYSLGVVAYELLAGRTPFQGSALEMQWAHATASPPSVRTLRPDCPPGLDALVMRMMAKSASDRWPTLHDVSQALADEPPVVSAARAALVTMVADVPGRRDATQPSTPASPIPIGPGPAAVGDATTDPVRATSDTPAPPPAAGTPNAPPAVAPMLTLSRQRIELKPGDSVELIVELEAGGQPTDGSSVHWESSDPAVAAVSPDGLVTAVGPGLAEVACVWRGRRAVCLVHVAAAAAVKPTPVAPVPAPLGRAESAAAEAGALDTRGPTREPAPTYATRMRGRWWIGFAAVGVATVVVFARSRGAATATDPAPDAVPSPPPNAAARPALDSTAATSPPSAPTRVATVPPATKGSQPGQQSAGGRAPTVTSLPPSTSSRPPASVDPRVAASTEQPPKPTPPAAPPVVAPVRADSLRMTTRVDTGGGYGARAAASSTAPSTAPPAAPASPNTYAPPRDSAADRIPPAPREIAAALFKEFANAINAQSFSRITGAYTQPNDPAAVKLWQDFLIFIRDYTPRASVRSTNVNAASNPPTITATIDFRWSNDAGFERVRSGTFTGVGVPIPDGWQLHRVQLGKKFW